MNQQDGVGFLRKDPILGKIIDNVGDYSLKRRNHHFAVLVESIISQQLATKAAESIFRRFTKLYPKFPTATQILATRRSKLRKTCIFFSSRRRHTRFDCDWSSDVCSSD